MLTETQKNKLRFNFRKFGVNSTVNELKKENPNAFLLTQKDLEERVFFDEPLSIHRDDYSYFIKPIKEFKYEGV
jgi:hypothetical protein|tara:strand:+ start:231 stop:452 length:222 start_codon:yes stop_codon:yes gene_type:complete